LILGRIQGVRRWCPEAAPQDCCYCYWLDWISEVCVWGLPFHFHLVFIFTLFSFHLFFFSFFVISNLFYLHILTLTTRMDNPKIITSQESIGTLKKVHLSPIFSFPLTLFLSPLFLSSFFPVFSLSLSLFLSLFSLYIALLELTVEQWHFY